MWQETERSSVGKEFKSSAQQPVRQWVLSIAKWASFKEAHPRRTWEITKPWKHSGYPLKSELKLEVTIWSVLVPAKANNMCEEMILQCSKFGDNWFSNQRKWGQSLLYLSTWVCLLGDFMLEMEESSLSSHEEVALSHMTCALELSHCCYRVRLGLTANRFHHPKICIRLMVCPFAFESYPSFLVGWDLSKNWGTLRAILAFQRVPQESCPSLPFGTPHSL